MLYVNKEFQRSQILKSIKQWCLYAGAVFLVVSLVGAWFSPSGLSIAAICSNLAYLVPAIVVSLLLLPILIYDMLKETNQIAGPIHRLRQGIHRLEAGEEIAEIKLRQNDHWGELATDFNRLAKQIQKERRQSSKSETTPNDRQAIYSFPEGVN